MANVVAATLTAHIQAQAARHERTGTFDGAVQGGAESSTTTGPQRLNFVATSTFGALSSVKASYNEDDSCSSPSIRSAWAVLAA